jgi:outer membrane protein assembly factor BamD (BamD/ComL family)
MGEGSYFNFDLIIERVGEKYRSRVFDSPAGQASAEFDLPFSKLELENFVLRMGRPRTGVRRVDSSEMEAVKQCGERLFRAVFSDDVYASFLRSRDTALDEGKGLRVRLRINVPEFHDYPWEFLYNAHLNQFLALSRETPVVRYLELPYPVQPFTIQPPLKILVMISSPEGFPKLQVEEEWKRLSNALAPLVRRGLVTLERLKKPTLSSLLQNLRRGEYHIFHFIGHGKYSEHKQDGMLLLEEETGQGLPVSGQYLGTVLHDHRSLQLVVLNACEGARTSQEDPYAGVAQTLVLQGIPAVIAMQFEIVETAAITFAQEFYGAVADGFPVDAAVSEARKAIFATGNDVEWGTPVLYMRTPQGVIFEIPEAQRVRHALSDEPISYVDKALEQKLEQLYTEGLAAFWVEDWDRACDRFQKILADRPDHAAAADKLAEAKRQRNLALLYSRAMEAKAAKNWSLALDTLEDLLKDAPDYKDSAGMLKTVKKQKQLAELYTEAKQLHAAQKWQAVAKVFTQIKGIDSNYPDPENLLSIAEKELAELKRLSELNELYSQAVHAMDAGQWDEAKRLLGQVNEKEPGYLETERLLSRVEDKVRQSEAEKKRQDQINTLYEQAHGLLRSKKWRQALEKIEETRKLDEQFEDTEKIAERAQLELAREEQEAERQNELAAMYAEAVRLLREEQYQEALEKWQEIKGIDPKYPDRQKVQRIARNSLAALAKPVKVKRRISVPKSLWIGVGGIVFVGVIIILALNLPGNNGQEPSSHAISAPTSASGGKVVLPTATKTPKKTNTPKLPMATQETSGYADPTMYDGFDESSTTVDTSRWSSGGNDLSAKISKQGGILTIETNGYGKGMGLIATKFQDHLIHVPFFVEGWFKLEPNKNGGVSMWLSTSDDEGTLCQIWGVHGSQAVHCQSYFDGFREIAIKGITSGTWHSARIEIDPSNMTFTYFIDGIKVGDYVPERADELKRTKFSVSIDSGCGGDGCNDKTPRTVTGYFDNIRIGAIEDDPIIYDNFNDSAYDGRFNPSFWFYEADTRSPLTKSIQENGELVFTQSGVNEGSMLFMKKYYGYKINSNTFFEARLKIDMSSDGFLVLHVGSPVWGDVTCGLHTGSDSVGAHSWTPSGDPYIAVAHGTWHTIRFEVDVEENIITTYIDGKQMAADHINLINGSILYVSIDISSGTYRSKDTRPVVGYVDDVRIGPLK